MSKKDVNPPPSFILLQGDSVHGYRATHLTIPESNPFSRFGRLQHQVNSFSENEDSRCIKTSGISHEEASATSTSWWNMLTRHKRILAGDSPWGCKESDLTERLTHIIRQDESKLQGAPKKENPSITNARSTKFWGHDAGNSFHGFVLWRLPWKWLAHKSTIFDILVKIGLLSHTTKRQKQNFFLSYF